MKRSLSFLLAFIMLVSMIPMSVVTALAADSAIISVEKVNATPDSTVEVAVYISDNPGIASMGLTLTFDEDLTLVGATNGEAFSQMTLTPPAQLKKGGSVTGSCRFAWLGSENVTENGAILHLEFAVAADADLNKDYAISITCAASDVLNEKRESVSVAISNGKITVIDYIPGDVDGDGVINMVDVLTLCQYYVDDCQYAPDGYGVNIRSERGDVDANGKINMIDVLMICQYYVDGCQYALEKKIRKKHKPVIPGKKPDNAAPLSPEAQNIQKAFSKVKAMNPEEIYDNWIRSTATSALKYFERHILPLLSQRADVSCTRETALLIQKKIRDTFRVSKANDLAAENRAVFRHLQEAEKIYRCMDHLSEEPLPVFDFSADSTLFARQEQFKVFPPADRRKIVKILEEEAAKNPLLVKRFVAMFDAGLRTGEACAVQFDNIQERVTPAGIRYGLYCVESQEDPANKGKVTKLLKTANAYRTVLFSSWGYKMIGICNQLAPETPSDTLPVTSVALCKEFRRIMGEIGITPETLVLYRQESGNAELDPAAGETLADAKLSDYIMRRDRASRWKNVCGMSSAEIDMLLGHKINGVNTYMHRKYRNEFTQPENLDRLAELNENFCYHPDIPPEISLTDRSAEIIPLPPRRVQIIRNNSDHPIEVLLNLQTIEPGDSIIERGASACRPEASVQSLPVSMKNPRPALGRGKKEEKYDDGKADLSLG